MKNISDRPDPHVYASRREEFTKRFVIGWEAVPYLLLIISYFFTPRGVSIFDSFSFEKFLATSWTVIFGLVLFGASVGLTFDGFMRFSRYRMSHFHRYLNMGVSLVGAVMPFMLLVIGPYATVMAYLIIGYSYYISPRYPETVAQRKFYQRKYFAYLVNAGLLSVILILILVTS